jgi:hypothetical protein
MRLLTEYNPKFLNQDFIDWLKDNVEPTLKSTSENNEEHWYEVNQLILILEEDSIELKRYMMQFNQLEELAEDGVDYICLNFNDLIDESIYISF